MAAGLRAGQAFAAAYTRAKRSAGVADFNDLIAWTRRLLATPGHGGLGPLQARPADRSHSRRRVPGHQSRAVGDRPGARRGIFRGCQCAPKGEAAPSSWSATSSRRSSGSRAPIRMNSSALATGFASSRRRLLEADEDARAGAALEFRDLSIEASYRSAPAILDVVDAVIADVDYRNMGLPDRPNPHRAHFYSRPGIVELWKPFAARGRRGGRCGRGRLARRRRPALRRRAGETGAPLARRSAGPGVDQAARERGRRPDPRAQPRRAGIADRRSPVRGRRPGRRHRPAAPAGAAGGQGFARGHCLCRSAAGRPQPREPARFASGGLEPGPAARAGVRARRYAAMAAARRAGRQRDRSFARPATSSTRFWRWRTTRPRTATWRRSCPGPMEGRRKLYGRLGMAARDPIDELLASALEFENQEIAVARPLPRLVRARRCRDQARPVRSGQRRSGHDRARCKGPGGADRHPRRCDCRSGPAGRRFEDPRFPDCRRWRGAPDPARARPSA